MERALLISIHPDWVEYPVRKAPQKCAWVYTKE
jgi:hypothetical protein